MRWGDAGACKLMFYRGRVLGEGAHLLRLEDRERLRERLSLPLRERLRE